MNGNTSCISEENRYNISEYTLNTYNYLIETLDEMEDIKAYKTIKSNPANKEKEGIASEIYTYFQTHYVKARDTYNSYEKQINALCMTSNEINIIDIGANVGTVTFAFFDKLICKGMNNIKINVIFIEIDKFRCDLLKLCIKKYKEESNLNVTFEIINKCYEESVDDIKKLIWNCNTVILMSNILKWINDIEKFNKCILDNRHYIEDKNICININIETENPEATNNLNKFYEKINDVKYRKIRNIQKNPIYNNIPNSYFHDQSNIKSYNNTNQKIYQHTCISNDLDYYYSLNLDIIKKAYYKALHTINNFHDVKDSLEIKYVNSNLDKVINSIYEMMKNSNIIGEKEFSYKYTRKKKNSEDRPLYYDDLINDIINASIITTKGIKLDANQDDKISFGNRIENDINSPHIFIPYLNQYEKYKKEKLNNASKYKYYFKIDIKSYYSNIQCGVLNTIIQEYDILMCKWYSNILKKFICKDNNILENEDLTNKIGIVQGSNMSHLLGNLYLSKFDEWFKYNYTECKLLRYVDDIIVFTNSEEENNQIYKSCISYLKEELKLDTHEESKDKEKLSKGLTQEIIEEYNMHDANYFNDIKNESYYILRTMYRLDRKNYKIFKKSPDEFINIYQKCLEELGIYLTKDWLNIKLHKEGSFLIKWFKKFKSITGFMKWTESKEIYDVNLKLGKIPKDLSQKSIKNWSREFRNKSDNKDFINLLDDLLDRFEKDIKGVIDEVVVDKSKINFLINKLKVFKIKNMDKYIDDIIDKFPHCSKKLFANYKECNEKIIKYLKDIGGKYGTYDYSIYIWILGEHKIKEGLDTLYDIFNNSFEDNERFINSIATEAILKILENNTELISSDDKFISLIDDIKSNKIKNSNDYYFIRNMLLILNVSIEEKLLKQITTEILNRNNNKRLKSFTVWIRENYKCNITRLIDDIPEEQKCKYPDYPFEEIYMSL